MPEFVESWGHGVDPASSHPRLGAQRFPDCDLWAAGPVCPVRADEHITGLGVEASFHMRAWRKPREGLQGGGRDGKGHRRAQFQPEEEAEKDWGRGPSCPGSTWLEPQPKWSGPFVGETFGKDGMQKAVDPAKGKPHPSMLTSNRIGQIKDGRPSWACHRPCCLSTQHLAPIQETQP